MILLKELRMSLKIMASPSKAIWVRLSLRRFRRPLRKTHADAGVDADGILAIYTIL